MPGERISLSALGQQLRQFREVKEQPVERANTLQQRIDALRLKESHRDAYFWSQRLPPGECVRIEAIRWINPDLIEVKCQGCFIYLCLAWAREQARLGRPIHRLGDILNTDWSKQTEVYIWDPLWLNERVALVKRFSLK